MKSLDQEWDDFMNYNESSCLDDIEDIEDIEDIVEKQSNSIIMNSSKSSIEIPKCSDIYISTKTKIAFLNRPVNLLDIFWKIKTINYCQPINGVVKKQMKFNSTTQKEVDQILINLKDELYYETHNITHIDNPEGRIKFKDIRKISIGISKKDILSYRCKKKSAFYNCFVLILRILENSIFKEYHVKVFNTGKLEIPGVQSDESFNNVLSSLINILSPYYEEDKIECLTHKSETVLINSNFNCGYYINREKLTDILKYKYKIQCIYDPCSYPGIQCKFYYNRTLVEQTGQPCIGGLQDDINFLVSFMIFRTGSVLIVGKCDESIIQDIYKFIKNILTYEYKVICQILHKVNTHEINTKIKTKKIRKKTILIDC